MENTRLHAIEAVTSGPRASVKLVSPEATSEQLLDTARLVADMESRAAAVKVVLIAELWRRQVGVESLGARSLDERAFTAEIATVLTLSERAAQSLIGNARVLVDHLPATLAALSNASISYRHAQILVEETAGLEPECAAALEEKTLASASHLTAPRFASKVRKEREKLHPESMDQRHEAALDDRTVVLDEARDGMMWISNKTDAATAIAIHDKLTTAAISLKKQGDTRTLAQLRSDIFNTVMLASDSKIAGIIPALDDTEHFVEWFAGIKAEVIVSVPVLSLLGESDEPATLEGYGPIDLGVARLLAARAPSFVRILTHPETGATLSVGRDRYKVPEEMKTFLRVRDGTCRFPNCSRRAKRCDIDHAKEWHELGETAHDNLGHLCRPHHSVKGAGKWKVAHASDGSGVLTWTSPMGHEYVTYPETMIGMG